MFCVVIPRICTLRVLSMCMSILIVIWVVITSRRDNVTKPYASHLRSLPSESIISCTLWIRVFRTCKWAIVSSLFVSVVYEVGTHGFDGFHDISSFVGSCSTRKLNKDLLVTLGLMTCGWWLMRTMGSSSSDMTTVLKSEVGCLLQVSDLLELRLAGPK